MSAKNHFNLPLFFGILILLFYAIVSFYHLGFSYAPTTYWESDEKGVSIVLDFGEEKELDSINFYLGNYENRRFAVEIGTEAPTVWTDLPELTMTRVYQWGRIPLDGKCRFLKLTTLNQLTEIKELIIRENTGEILIPVNKAQYPALFDEAWMYPDYAAFQSGTVFDELVFSRTAYEYLRGIRSYEDTHPPLGKLLISAGIACFGMNPFGWRAASAVAGILLLVLIWMFSAELFYSPWTSVGVLALFALDFMHFTESRLGQVDSFLVLFITGMYFFMFCYVKRLEYGNRKYGWWYLFASGLCMGAAASCKWSGLYGVPVLALIWIIAIVRQYRQGKITKTYIRTTFCACFLFFVIIPAAIYLLSYIPYVAADESLGFWERVWINQVNMFQYHAHMDSYHPSASQWFQWPIIGKPVKLHSIRFYDGDAESLILMGNPAFWWSGIIVVFVSLYQLVGKVERKTAFLLAAYIAPVLPWIGITRSSFLYHYYPSLPFMALLIGLCSERWGKRGRYFLFACVAASGVLFVLFYPVISGTRVSQEYIFRWLEWLPGWEFVY